MITEQETIERGIKAEALMSLDVFQELFDDVQKQITQDILATSPDDHKGREELYQTFHGMRAFTATLNAYRLAMLQIIEQREEANKENTVN